MFEKIKNKLNEIAKANEYYLKSRPLAFFAILAIMGFLLLYTFYCFYHYLFKYLFYHYLLNFLTSIPHGNIILFLFMLTSVFILAICTTLIFISVGLILQKIDKNLHFKKDFKFTIFVPIIKIFNIIHKKIIDIIESYFKNNPIILIFIYIIFIIFIPLVHKYIAVYLNTILSLLTMVIYICSLHIWVGLTLLCIDNIFIKSHQKKNKEG
jgi:hypothetical protein